MTTTIHRASLVLAAVLGFSASAAAQTWTGGGTVWNTASNWSPAVVPNSVSAAVNFAGNGVFYAVAITSSVSAESLSFSNPTLSYSLTSSAGVSLSNVKEINVAAGVTGVQSINLANIATGSLRFPTGSDLAITNNSAAAGTTLVIGPTTVIGTPGFGGVTVDGAGTTQISGSFAVSGTGNAVVGGLTKYGTGTLILAPPAGNTYTGGTYVYDGTLLLGTGSALSTGSFLTVNDAEFNIGNVSNTAATFVDRIDVNYGAFRVPSGNGDYYVRTLDMSGATLDFTGSSNFWLHVAAGSGSPAPGIYVNTGPTGIVRTTNWIGSGTSRIQNDNASPIPIQVGANATVSGIDLDAGIILSSGGTNPTFIKEGAGTMRLTNPGNTANINLVAGTLRVDDMANLGSGIITVNGGTLHYGGDGETTTKSLTTAGAATILVSSPGANLNYNGIINQSSYTILYVLGPGAGSAPSTLTLANNNNYAGLTFVYNNAILAMPTISNVGQPSPIGSDPLNLGIALGTADSRGTLLLTGTSPLGYSTNRTVALNGLYLLGAGGAFGVENANTTLTLSGQITGSGSLSKTGPGTLFLSNISNAYAGGTYVDAGRLHVNNDAVLGAAAVRIYADGVVRYNLSETVGRSIILDSGAIEAPAGISLANGGGGLQGTGTAVGNVANSGNVVPEGANGVLHIQGNYTQNASGRLIIFADLFLQSGTNPKLEVTGDVALAGTLQMNLGGMGQFRGHRSIDVLDWTGNLSGTFSTLQLPLMGGAFTWDTSQLYVTGVLTLTGPPREGDYNNDGTVNAADYTVWRNNLGDATEQDINNAGDGLNGVDAADFTRWKQHYGDSSSGSGSGADANAAVPEPATWLLLIYAVAGWSLRRPRGA